MPLTALLDNLFIQSLLQIYDCIFKGALAIVSPGWSLIVFSGIINLALLPLYYQMERAGRVARLAHQKMNQEILRIKAHYTGRERYFYVRTIHRQFGYHPLSTILSSGDLFLQILVFVTVYRYLSHNPALTGSGFGAIEDLGHPDGLLWGVNLLPILMTLFNVGSAVLYGGDRSKRPQSFVLAVVFLVLLYRSPAGLVLYWTCNNGFSLIRNWIEKKLVPALPARVAELLSNLAHQE